MQPLESELEALAQPASENHSRLLQQKKARDAGAALPIPQRESMGWLWSVNIVLLVAAVAVVFTIRRRDPAITLCRASTDLRRPRAWGHRAGARRDFGGLERVRFAWMGQKSFRRRATPNGRPKSAPDSQRRTGFSEL
jgi:hypothetical protein